MDLIYRKIAYIVLLTAVRRRLTIVIERRSQGAPPTRVSATPVRHVHHALLGVLLTVRRRLAFAIERGSQGVPPITAVYCQILVGGAPCDRRSITKDRRRRTEAARRGDPCTRSRCKQRYSRCRVRVFPVIFSANRDQELSTISSCCQKY